MFLADVRAILGDRFVGLYLHGSLALGDFDPERLSDIDFLVVTAEEIPDAMVAALAAMHARMAASASVWARELEGSYIPVKALRRYDLTRARHPLIERHGRLVVEQHWSDWVIHRHVLREHGVVVAGPLPHTLIDAISPDELRRTALELLHEWWVPMLRDPSRLHDAWYQAYAVLTMCRILHTLQHGSVVSKLAAATWAQTALGEPWTGLIERALARRKKERFDHLRPTMDFIRYTVSRSAT